MTRSSIASQVFVAQSTADLGTTQAIDLIDEARSRVRLQHAQLPEEARELDKELRNLMTPTIASQVVTTQSKAELGTMQAIDLIDEAGSRVRLQHAQLPEEARELDKELRNLMKEKDAAVRGQDFEKAGSVRPTYMVAGLCVKHA